ncbi:MAG: serine/threonine-protein phosphatase [Myxococcales bacterium]|nr:serine/threonine-protein phosphatase [Myxococcales bacterium]
MPAAQVNQTELRLHAFGLSDIGLRRKNNEDVVLVRDDLALYLVCDGAGGHDAGDIAAQTATRTVTNLIAETRDQALGQPDFDVFGLARDGRLLATAAHRANQDIMGMSRAARSRRGMGTTLVALLFTKRASMAHLVHVGDSRCYRLRAGHLEQLTTDHSMINDVIEQRPDLDDDVLSSLPQHAVTRALGMEDKLRVPLASREVVDGDRFLLCSDGLSGPVAPDAIAQALSRGDPPAETVVALIDLAKAAGAPDNVTALVIDCQGPKRTAVPVYDRASFDSLPSAHPSDPEILLLGIEEIPLEEIRNAELDELGAVLARLIRR